MRPILSCLFAALTLGLNACRTPATATTEKAPAPPPLYDWQGDQVAGALKVEINLSEQKAHLFKGGAPVGWTYVATGVEGRRTPTGHFTISEKKADKSSNRFGVVVNSEGSVVNWNATNGVSSVPEGGKFVGAPMPNWMRLTNYGIGMHAGPIPHPGSTASHGCIRLPEFMAQKLFENAVLGTSVSIYP